MELSERLKKVFAAGGTMELFPLLRDWPVEELQALLKDVEEYARYADLRAEEVWQNIAFQAPVFFNRKASAEVDRALDETKARVMMVTSEICSVAIFYLEEYGVKVEIPGGEI